MIQTLPEQCPRSPPAVVVVAADPIFGRAVLPLMYNFRMQPVPKKIKVKAFDALRGSLADALAFEQGRPVDLRVTELPPSPRCPRTPLTIR